MNGNIAVRFNTRERQIFFHAKFLVIPENAIVCEGKAAAVNMTKERVVVLVKLRIALGGHARVTHHDVYVVGQVDFHFPSGKRALVDAHTTIEVVRDAGCIGAAHLALSCKSIENSILHMGAQALLKVD